MKLDYSPGSALDHQALTGFALYYTSWCVLMTLGEESVRPYSRGARVLAILLLAIPVVVVARTAYIHGLFVWSVYPEHQAPFFSVTYVVGMVERDGVMSVFSPSYALDFLALFTARTLSCPRLLQTLIFVLAGLLIPLIFWHKLSLRSGLENLALPCGLLLGAALEFAVIRRWRTWRRTHAG